MECAIWNSGLNFDIFVPMKKLVFFLFLIPFMAMAQLDFETNKVKLDFVNLPELESLMTTPLPAKSDFSNISSKRLPSFKLSRENYREPVSMYEAVVSSENFVQSSIKISLDPKELGIYGGNSSYSADGSTRVKNMVYEDARRGFLFADTCPPYGICPRCAPTRIGRRY